MPNGGESRKTLDTDPSVIPEPPGLYHGRPAATCQDGYLLVHLDEDAVPTHDGATQQDKADWKAEFTLVLDDEPLAEEVRKPSGPTAGSETLDPLAFLARVVSHIPNKGQVLQRYYGWYANRTRGRRRRAEVAAPAPRLEPAPGGAAPPTLPEARRRWAELLRRIFEVDPLCCPRCGEAMRIVGFVTQPGVIARILEHLRRRAVPSRQPRARPPHRRVSRPTTPA